MLQEPRRISRCRPRRMSSCRMHRRYMHLRINATLPGWKAPSMIAMVVDVHEGIRMLHSCALSAVCRCIIAAHTRRRDRMRTCT